MCVVWFGRASELNVFGFVSFAELWLVYLIAAARALCLQADASTDEVYAQLSLLPENEVRPFDAHRQAVIWHAITFGFLQDVGE